MRCRVGTVGGQGIDSLDPPIFSQKKISADCHLAWGRYT
jgi:hypothetical protein